ncbi:MAG: hypothetical protein PHC66_02700 [Candidatus Nanoarchaeia archaeon]|nr:hypothetical protein [Candidatus Nanoarchaeia archaeon]MDD5239397.1 hypothetical protein [Candidatus Nanoarchaeia archaeon]
MVLESIFDTKKLLERPFYLFGLVIVISLIGLLTSFLLFPDYFGVMSIAFIALLLFPLLHNIFTGSAENHFKKSRIDFVLIFKQHYPIFKTFAILMLAVFVVFLALGIVFTPEMSAKLFKEQLGLVEDSVNTVSGFNFHAIAQNNVRVVFITFGISLIYGAGVIIMISWNASVWGVIIGSSIRKGISLTGSSALAYIAAQLAQIVPHMILESLAYLGAAISGGLLAICVVFQNIHSKRFVYTITDSLFVLTLSIILILLSAIIEINI